MLSTYGRILKNETRSWICVWISNLDDFNKNYIFFKLTDVNTNFTDGILADNDI